MQLHKYLTAILLRMLRPAKTVRTLTRDVEHSSIAFDDTAPMPRFLRIFGPRKPARSIELLALRKERFLQMLEDANESNSLLIRRIENSSNHLELILAASDLFPCMSRRYGERTAKTLIANAMNVVGETPITKPFTLESQYHE